MIQFTLDANGAATPFPHYWELCVGSCHGYTALRENYRRQLGRAHDELGFKYVRFHGIFDDDMCVCYEKKDPMGGNQGIVHNFMNTDSIFDFLLDIGMKPFVEIGFMPTCLASGTTTCFHYKGNITPPRDYKLWNEFIHAFIVHNIDRYGLDEVKQWFFEVWNEPNLAFFWDGTKEQYFELYKNTAQTIKSVDEGLRVGGPATSINAWIPDMIEFCKNNQVPLDFVSTHHYPTDDPLWKNSDMTMEEFFTKLGSEFGKYERGILKKMTSKAKAEAGEFPLYYTEWNTSANSTDTLHDEPYAAAMVAKILADNDGLVEGYSFWTFTDIFEEGAQSAKPFHGGFGLQNFYGVAKPVYRTFEIFHELGDERLSVACDTPESTVEVLATRTKNGIKLAAYNHQVPTEPVKNEEITICIDGLEGVSNVWVRRVDDDHANAKKAWIAMGEPEYLKAADVEKLHEASELTLESMETVMENGQCCLSFTVPVNGVCAVEIDF